MAMVVPDRNQVLSSLADLVVWQVCLPFLNPHLQAGLQKTVMAHQTQKSHGFSERQL
jgi:hypothetical protein